MAAACAMGLDIDVSDNPGQYLRLFSTCIINLEDSEREEEIQPGC
jgi:hypothetical protein